MSRKPVNTDIRDKNFTFNAKEEEKQNTNVSLKEQKMNEISEHRRMALLGNKQERAQITDKYMYQAKNFDNARKTQKQIEVAQEKQIEREMQASYLKKCQEQDQQAYDRRMKAIQISNENKNMGNQSKNSNF